MAVHIFDAEDSDGDSWMEVVEGSPGPSMQNSRASLIYNAEEKVESTRKTASWVADETWVSDFEEYKDIKGSDARTSSVHTESLPPHDCFEDKAQPVSDPHHMSNSAYSQIEQKLRLDRPEVGDIIRHFNEVQALATAQPRKGLYYRLWLCWMYRMEWPQIEHTAQHAPDYIKQVVNYWFGLRNHPFWTASDKCPSQWYAMYRACLDTWKWWGQKSTDVEDDSDRTITQESFRNSAIDRRHRTYELPSASQVETRYSTFYGRIVGTDNIIRPDSSTTLQPHEYTSTTPRQVGDNFSFVVCTYKSFGSRNLGQAAQGAISFQTWIHWMHQVNLQPSSKQWAGHDLWPSSSPSASSLTPALPFPSVALKSIGDVAYEYVKDIGLPYKAAAYYQSVSYI